MARCTLPIPHWISPKAKSLNWNFRVCTGWAPTASCTLLTKDVQQPNGLAFSPDGKRFYVDDDDQKNIRVYDVTADMSLTNGKFSGRKPGKEAMECRTE